MARDLPPVDDVVVCLLGSAPELGAWDTSKAVPLEPVERKGEESTWFVSVVFAKAATPLEYKYLVKRKDDGSLVSWETIPGNRTLTPAHGINVALDKPASQSSTHVSTRVPCPGSRVASLGNNGNTNGFQEWRCCRTNTEANPWWEVDLESEHKITSLHLWKGLSYHELPMHPHSRPAASTAMLTSSASPPRPLWVFISNEPMPRGADSLQQLQALAKKEDATVFARQIELSRDNRVESIDLVDWKAEEALNAAVSGRYVRVQHATSSSVLQFAEVQVFAESEDSDDQSKDTFFKHDDGLYGLDSALDGELDMFVDSGWLNPAEGTAQLRFWIGSFNETLPALQWGNGRSSSAPVTINMRCQTKTEEPKHDRKEGSEVPSAKKKRKTTQAPAPVWKTLPVDARGAALLDKDSVELEAAMTKQPETEPLGPYLNNFQLTNEKKEVAARGSHWLHRLDIGQFLKAKKLEALEETIQKKSFKKGDTLLFYGEHRRCLWYVSEGEVELRGPASSRGSVSVGTIGSKSVWNEGSLLGKFAAKSATFVAKSEHLVCEVLTFDALMAVLGEDVIVNMREHYARELFGFGSLPKDSSESNTERRTPRKSKMARREEQVHHFCDRTHAQVFRTRVPLACLESGKSGSLSSRMAFDVYDCSVDDKTGLHYKQQLLGTAYLIPSHLNEHGEGVVTLPILGHGSGDGELNGLVGQLTITFLVTKPMEHPQNNLSHVWRSYWRERSPLNVGHRGMGRSFHQVGGHRHALIRENTLASFILAGRSGADFVEFDVQLTKEKIPVLYHDFHLKVGLEDKRAWSHGSGAEDHELGIHEMTMRQLARCHTHPIARKATGQLHQRVRKHWSHITGKKREFALMSEAKEEATEEKALSDSEVLPLAATEDDHLVDFYPRLEDLLKHVPQEVGLNVEIKYPDNFKRTALRYSPAFAMNMYLDTILQCIFDHAGSRRIFFSCFDPNICVALRAKQAKYPVFFLTYGRAKPAQVDARVTLQYAVNFVKMEKLMGMVSNSDHILENPALVRFVKNQGIVFMTWGDQNTSHDKVQLQKRHAVDAVISDNIIDLIRANARPQEPAAVESK
ncbi:TPA: hypothetical protein N0F65_005393 [Lagenidium giganteum]|uniref:Glycerophosphocholine phosphodiesterase GPCPD1 n=1 Tax=Lagenidium giganteum TaxID=4803 RepID=A0AAV2Z144_9STRA|nr:TPA: hypothetical protein N0F65_005393 [Lagenidium giganteum]